MVDTVVLHSLFKKLLQKYGLKRLLAIVAASLYAMSKVSQSWRFRNTPPGSFGLPILGETLAFVADCRKFAESRVKKYGPVFTTHVLFTPTVYLSGEASKLVFKNNMIGWPSTWNDLLGPHSISVLNGPAHKRVRSHVVRAFSNEALTSYLPVLQELTMKHLDRWATKSTTVSAPYDPAEDIQLYTFEVAEKLLLGRSTGDVDGGLIDTFNVWLRGYEGVVPFDVPWTAHGKAMRARKLLMGEYRKIIQEKRAAMSQGGEDQHPATKLQRDMLARVMNSTDENGEKASEEQLMDFCITMMFAGHDTTKASIQSMLHLLSLEPHIERELAEEVGKLWDGTSPITWEIINALEHGKCGRFIGEQLRILPQVPGCYRVVGEDMKVNGYTIPQGWKIMTSPAANQTMLEGNKQTIDLTLDHSKYKESEYHPFGGGGRGCVGYRFAKAELLIWMMCLFKHYRADVDATQTKIVTMPFLYASVKATFQRQEKK